MALAPSAATTLFYEWILVWITVGMCGYWAILKGKTRHFWSHTETVREDLILKLTAKSYTLYSTVTKVSDLTCSISTSKNNLA